MAEPSQQQVVPAPSFPFSMTLWVGEDGNGDSFLELRVSRVAAGFFDWRLSGMFRLLLQLGLKCVGRVRAVESWVWVKYRRERFKHVTTDITDLKKSVNFTQDKLESANSQINTKVDFNLTTIRHIEDKIDDINNRNRRNNIVIQGVPEGSEAGQNCEAFVYDFL